MTGTFINVGTVLLGTLIGALLGQPPARGAPAARAVRAGPGRRSSSASTTRWPGATPTRSTCSAACCSAAWPARRSAIEAPLARARATACRRRFSGPGHSTIAEGFFTASLLFCVGPLAVLGSIQDGLSGDYETLATKALLDGFAAIALAAALGLGVGFAAITVLVYQGAITLAAGLFTDILAEGSEALAALTSAGGVLIIGIALKLLQVKDVKVGNYLPALVFAPCLVGLVSLVS